MINILPDDLKRKIETIKKIKIMINFEIILIFCLIALAIVESFLKFYFLQIIEQEKLSLKSLENQKKEIQIFEEKIEKYNNLFEKLISFKEKEKISNLEILQMLSKNLPDGVYFTNLTIEKENIFISGFSKEREGILKFKEGLEKEKMVKTLQLPQKYLVYPENINFSMTIKLK
jgi:cell division protein FtsI/penicillin-binding protein 2